VQRRHEPSHFHNVRLVGSGLASSGRDSRDSHKTCQIPLVKLSPPAYQYSFVSQAGCRPYDRPTNSVKALKADISQRMVIRDVNTDIRTGFYGNRPVYTTCCRTNGTQPSQTDYVMRKHLHPSPLGLKNFASHLYRTVWIFMISTFVQNSRSGLCTVGNFTLLLTLDVGH